MGLDKRWTDTIDSSLNETNARVYDAHISKVVADYNKRLATTPGYVAVDWKLIRAMAWVESGPKNLAWNGRVMQIGNAGDPGLAAVKSREGATSLLVPSDTLARLDKASAATINEPFFNIEIAVAYLWMRQCKSEVASIVDDPTVHEYKLKSGESPGSVARELGTTIADFQASNPGVDFRRLHPGDTLKYHKAHTGRRITGWIAFNPDTVAAAYNTSKGDPTYPEKLRYVMRKITW